MNIFFLSKDPEEAARWHCDRHVCKMVVESAQMLSTAHRMLDGQKITVASPRKKTVYEHPSAELYKAVHHNHPCTQWTMASLSNYQWHYHLFSSLCDEYTYRYGKIHKTDSVLRLTLRKPPVNIPDRGFIVPALAMKKHPECIVPGDPVTSYQNYYRTKREAFNMAWTKRPIPEWF